MKRLASLDALRGFDMFFITGGATLILGLCTAFGCGEGWLAHQMDHVPWSGLAHHDTIFPLFLFLAGVSWPFSLAGQRAKGRTAGQIDRKILLRAAILFLFGLSFGGIVKFSPTFRLMSVLGFIGLCWGSSAFLFHHVEGWGRRAVLIAALFLGYFALLHFGVNPAAPAGADTYSNEWNIVRWLDLHVYPEHLMIPVSKVTAEYPIAYEPESIFSLPGGMIIALLGMCAGSLLKSDRISPARKAVLLAGAGLVSLVLTFVLVGVLGVTIVKALWTVSFASAAVAYSCLMLALFYWLVDVKGFSRWTVIFDPIGKNSILAYLMMMTGVMSAVQNWLFKGCIDSSGAWSKAVWGATFYALTWVVLRYCQKKNVFLKV